MHLFNIKQLFFRRRKYDRRLGRGLPHQEDLDLVPSSPSPTSSHQRYNHLPSNNHTTQRKTIRGSSKHGATSEGSATATADAAAASSSSVLTGTLWGLKLRPKLRMRKQKSLKLVSTSTNGPQPAKAAVQNFLQGPSQDDEIYNQHCRDLLRKLSARGNRVPGFI